jgi:hypothetical protein
MNSKLNRQIIDFMNNVGWYISMEYGVEYNYCWNDKYILNDILYPLIGSYYMGGNTVPDTAAVVVETVIKKGLI